MARINRNPAKDRAQAWAIRSAISILKLLPFALRKRWAGWLMKTAVLRISALRGRIEKNLTLVWPNLSADRRAEIAGEVGRSFGTSMIEVFSPRDFRDQSANFHVSGAGLDALLAAQALGKGGILVSAHFGQWEAVRVALLERGIACGGVYRPNNNQVYDADFHRALEAFGKPIFSNDHTGTRALLRHVGNGGVVMMLLDQHIFGTPMFTFFGKEARTATIAADLALKFRLPLIACYGIRRASGPCIDVVLEAPIPLTDATAMTQELNDSLEARVRENPGQWYWLHQRWRMKKPSAPS